jgi:hypothetical protein
MKHVLVDVYQVCANKSPRVKNLLVKIQKSYSLDIWHETCSSGWTKAELFNKMAARVKIRKQHLNNIIATGSILKNFTQKIFLVTVYKIFQI